MPQQKTTTQRSRQRLLGLLSMTAGFWSLAGPSAVSLEFGLTGDSPPAFAQAAGKDLVYSDAALALHLQ
jgi:sulfonate transport system substrate-binding protein